MHDKYRYTYSIDKVIKTTIIIVSLIIIIQPKSYAIIIKQEH